MPGPTTRPPPRLPTHNAPPSLDSLAAVMSAMERELWDLSREMAKSSERDQDMHDLLIELVGRDGRAGVVRELREAHRASAESQGKRIGALESAMSSLRTKQALAGAAFAVTRGQLAVLAVLGLAVLGAALKFLVAGPG